MFEELINSVMSFNEISDEGLESVKDKIQEIVGSMYSPSDVDRYLVSVLEQARDSGITYEEYKSFVNGLREEITQAHATIEANCNSKVKSDFINSIIDPILPAIDAAESYVDFFHVHIKVEKCRENAVIPTYAHPWDAGADVYAVEDCTVYVGDTKIIPTGLKMDIPRGWMVSVRPRSGLSVKTGLRVANAPGTIDTGYLDEVGIIISNCGEQKYEIHKGDRIAQFVVERRWTAQFDEVDSVSDAIDNREGGFGSSGQ